MRSKEMIGLSFHIDGFKLFNEVPEGQPEKEHVDVKLSVDSNKILANSKKCRLINSWYSRIISFKTVFSELENKKMIAILGMNNIGKSTAATCLVEGETDGKNSIKYLGGREMFFGFENGFDQLPSYHPMQAPKDIFVTEFPNILDEFVNPRAIMQLLTRSNKFVIMLVLNSENYLWYTYMMTAMVRMLTKLG